MILRLLKHSVLISCLSLIVSCHTPEQPLTIATAANMQFAMEALSKEFTKQTQIECQLVISSSGKLTSQILAGAPYDVFTSADLKYPNELYQKGLTTLAPKIYALGNLVLWTAQKNINPNLVILSESTIKHIAIANPKTAPYGKAAMEVLNSMSPSIKHKLVYGESIAQVNQFVSTQAVEIGFTSLSVVLAQQKGNWSLLPKNQYSSIKQGVVVIKSSKRLQEANQFQNFLLSKKGKDILKEFGFEPK